ncbi:hypothetical protein K525DRAFT_274001 [Schizophyllum commune Loenen D]|nr:hypothetical protein K525DRAFT_274001 [Schizophyllum commune Loenen D]
MSDLNVADAMTSSLKRHVRGLHATGTTCRWENARLPRSDFTLLLLTSTSPRPALRGTVVRRSLATAPARLQAAIKKKEEEEEEEEEEEIPALGSSEDEDRDAELYGLCS